MSPDYSLQEPPFAEPLVAQVQALSAIVFAVDDGSEVADIWRFEHMPQFTLCAAHTDSRLVGFKLGYAHTQQRYYSWLGGIDPAYRRQGIAWTLMRMQHEWATRQGFKFIETGAQQNNIAMGALNFASGFEVVGIRYKQRDSSRVTELTYEKSL